jgi:alpha-pyrone synthase
MVTAHINRIATAVPANDIHQAFVGFARTMLESAHDKALLDRLVAASQIAHRFSVLAPSAEPTGRAVDAERFYSRGSFPSTAVRMRLYEERAPGLAEEAVKSLDLGLLTSEITHVIVTSCTGFSAPGLDLQICQRCGLDPSVERTVVGFMGCYAAMNALKLARHIVRSESSSKVLVLNLELCSLHFQETSKLEKLLACLVFADGCAASLISADPRGLAMDSFRTVVVPDTREFITWNIRNQGFDMFLSGGVPAAIAKGLEASASVILDGASPRDIDVWAVHPGGRSVLDAVERSLRLDPAALRTSRSVLSRFGNMSSATVMFVLESILSAAAAGDRGCGMGAAPFRRSEVA